MIYHDYSRRWRVGGGVAGTALRSEHKTTTYIPRYHTAIVGGGRRRGDSVAERAKNTSHPQILRRRWRLDHRRYILDLLLDPQLHKTPRRREGRLAEVVV